MSKQALYDFDGTITKKDTTKLLLVELLKLRPWRFPGLIWYVLRIIFAKDIIFKQVNKNKAIGYMIKGLGDTHLSKALREFRSKVKSLYRPSVLASINQAFQDDCTVLIVTASPAFAISNCVSDLPVLVLGTEFEKKDSIYTGYLQSENCYGREKVNRINEWATSNKVTLNVQSAWSDNFSDFDMLSLSEKRYWVAGEHLRKLLMDCDPEANFLHTEQ